MLAGNHMVDLKRRGMQPFLQLAILATSPSTATDQRLKFAVQLKPET